MSARKVRQLLAMQQKNEPPKAPTVPQEDEEVPKPRRTNMFAAFNQEDSDQEQTKESQQPQPKPEVKSQPPKEETKVADTIQQPEQETKAKKSKKNKKKKHQKEEGDEDIEKILEEQFGKHQVEQEEKDDSPHYDVLEINENKFNYQKELSKYFKDTKEENDGEEEGMNKRDKKYMKAMARHLKKSTLAGGIKGFFPLSDKFQVETKDHVVTFNVSKKMEVLREEYESIKNSNDIQEMFDFFEKHPDNVDALYNVGEFLRLKGDYKQADVLIQKIIYIYEQSCLYEIGLMLKENHPQNKFAYNRNSTAFFMSLFKFIDILGKKGCYKSALEYNKFLLKLNLDDPTACILCLDYNACSGKQYEFLLQFISHFGEQFNTKPQKQTIYWLPNLMYSAALASFELATQVKSSAKVIEQINIQPQLTFTQQHLKKALDLISFNVETQSPQVLILRALILYPKIFKDIAAKNDYSKQALGHSVLKNSQKLPYKDILAHEFFGMAPDNYFYSFLELESEADSKGMLKALETYPMRSRILWKTANVMLWVKAAAGFLIDNLEGIQYQKLVEKLCIKQNNIGLPTLAFRLGRYENVSKSNFTDQVQRVDLNNIQDNQAARPAEANPINLTNNPLRLFLESLLPWRHLPNAEQDPNMPQIEDEFE